MGTLSTGYGKWYYQLATYRNISTNSEAAIIVLHAIRDSKLHAAPSKSARGSGKSHRNPQIRMERNRLGAPKSDGRNTGIDFEES